MDLSSKLPQTSRRFSHTADSSVNNSSFVSVVRRFIKPTKMFGNSSLSRVFFVYGSLMLVIAISVQTALANDGNQLMLVLAKNIWKLIGPICFFIEFEDVKSKRGGNVGLFPFPRVGRSDPELSSWDPALLSSLDDYNGCRAMR